MVIRAISISNNAMVDGAGSMVRWRTADRHQRFGGRYSLKLSYLRPIISRAFCGISMRDLLSLTPISLPIVQSHSIRLALSSCRRDRHSIIYHFLAAPARDVGADFSCFDGIAHHRRRRQELHRIYTSSAAFRRWGASLVDGYYDRY
jgi:hypothetical protein